MTGEDVDPKALEIAKAHAGHGNIERTARAITALLREKECEDPDAHHDNRIMETYCPECGIAGECSCVGNWKARASDAEAKLRERDEEIARLQRVKFGTPCRCESWMDTAREAEERAQKAEAALAKKDEALREIIAVIQRTYGSDPSQRGVAKNRIERIAREARGE